MAKEHLITKGVISSFLINKKTFLLSELKNSIIQEGGIMRIVPCVTVLDYIRNLQKFGIVNYKWKNNDYIVSVIEDIK